MSYCHLRLVLSYATTCEANYSVQSPDFNSARQWKEIGTLRIDRSARSYQFEQNSTLLERHFIPPWLYGLSEDERKQRIAQDFNQHGYGAWAMAIHQYATKLIEQGGFPEIHPTIYSQS